MGYKIAAPTEPKDTILVSIISTKANIKQIRPICQFIINNTPNAVATPFPPLKPKKIGKVCPNTTKIAASCTKVSAPSLVIRPVIYAIKTATTPFKMSHIKVIIEAFFPTVRSTFVVPAFPLPFSLTSKPAIFLLIITEKLMLPNK